jgi:outer membrane protein OmpA-like peptidoglycan-associated protein
MSKRLALLTLLCISLVAVPGLQAQTIAVEDQVNMQAPTFTGESGLFQTLTGQTLKKGDWTFGIYYNTFSFLAAPAPELAPPSNHLYRDMDVDMSQMSGSLGYGITDRWEVSVSLPYQVLDQKTGDMAGYVNGYPYVGKFDVNEVGNTRFGTKFGLLGGDNPNKLALTAYYDLNTGDEDSGIATGSPNYAAGFAWTRNTFNMDASFVKVGERKANNSPEGLAYDMPNEVHLDLGANVPLKAWSATNWVTELNTVWYTGGERQPEDLVNLVSGIRHWFGTTGWGASAAARVNIAMLTSDTNEGEWFGVLAGVHYAPQHVVVQMPPPPAPVPVAAPPPEPVAPVAPPPEPPPVAAPRGPQQLRADDVLFDNGSARLTNIAKALLDDIALRMKEEPTSTLTVDGYTDGKEKTGKAKDLDKRRAEAVRDYLVSRHGIDTNRITLNAAGVDANATRHAATKLMVP